MKKILFHIGSLQAGGAEKSLLTLLRLLPKDIYSIDVLVFNKSGLFLSDIPDYINVNVVPFPYRFLSISPRFIKTYLKFPLKYLFIKLLGFAYSIINKKFSVPQSLWQCWNRYIPLYDKQYDIAVSYLEGLTNYYVIDKIVAKKKILWIHNEYNKLKYNVKFDENYFRIADSIVTISDICKQDLIRNFPNLRNKFHVLENISDSALIEKKAAEPIIDDFFSSAQNMILLSVGRLSVQKNYPLALKTAQILMKKNVKFDWFIIGEGNLRHNLEIMAKNLSVDKIVHFLGLRENPYSYMKHADIIVMSSLFEGKSIVIDEAKILLKPIVSVNYPTVRDNITDHETGIITDMTPEALAAGILELYGDKDLQVKITNNLIVQKSNKDEIFNYIKLFES